MDKEPKNPEPKRVETPTLEDAKRDRQEFDSLVSITPNHPRVTELKNKAELWANFFLGSSGSIPAGDPRIEIFEEYNAILEKWGQL